MPVLIQHHPGHGSAYDGQGVPCGTSDGVQVGVGLSDGQPDAVDERDPRYITGTARVRQSQHGALHPLECEVEVWCCPVNNPENIHSGSEDLRGGRWRVT